ncbi:hypothetical protein L1887_34816 [Cichorium endivia]|nr:hypothetical protein L1887_34816 [Cichorium endivia]
MEVFTGEHGLPSDGVLFPDTHLIPFTLPTVDPFSDKRKTSIDQHHFHPPQPPQKLRPIRCNGRSFTDCCSTDDPIDTKPLSWQPETGFYNTEIEDGSFIPPKASTLGLSSKECQTEAALSSSDESSKLQDSTNEPVNKKRKRKSRKKLESFIESMMKTVIKKQEEMHQQLINVLEQKETERIKREETWKKQETERAKREEQARKQEISRSLALISFIQNSLGQKIEIPNPIESHENQNDLENCKSDVGNDLEVICDPSNNLEEHEFDSNIKRWPKSEVQALITVRVALNQKFTGKGLKGSLWEEVAAGLSGMGYNRTPKKCKEKWENINKYYRRTMEKGKESGGKSNVCAYFNELEMLYKSGFISGTSHDEDQNQTVKGLE